MGSRKDGDFSDLDEQPASASGGCGAWGRVRRRARARAARVSDRRDRPPQATRGRGRRRGRAGDDRGPRVRSHRGRSQIWPTRHAYACPAGCAGHDRARGTSVTRACSGFASGSSYGSLVRSENASGLPEAFPGHAEKAAWGHHASVLSGGDPMSAFGRRQRPPGAAPIPGATAGSTQSRAWTSLPCSWPRRCR
jgi:hypothetical protein